MVTRSLSLHRNSLSKTELLWYIFIFLNVLALFQFGILQFRTLFSDYYARSSSGLLLRLLVSYNGWALGALIIIKLKSAKSRWYHHLMLFLTLLSLYGLTLALFNNSSPYQFWRGFIMNITGLININLFFYLSILTAAHYFLTKPNPETAQERAHLILKDGRALRYFDKSEIVYIKSEQNYALIKSRDSNPVLIRKTLKEIESMLNEDEHFVRIQRSYIINSNYISEAHTADNGIDMLCKTTTGDTIPISRQKKNWLKSLSEERSIVRT